MKTEMKTEMVAYQANNFLDYERVSQVIADMEEAYREDIKIMSENELPEEIETTEEQRILEEILQDRKTFISAVQEAYLPVKDAANKAHRAVTKSEGKMIEVATAQKEHISAVLSDFQTKKMRALEKEKQIAHAVALASAEKKRQEEITKLKSINATAEKIEAVTDAPLAIVIHKIPDILEKSNARYTKTISATVSDIKSFLQAIIDGKIPDQVIEVKTAKLNALVKAGIRHSSITVVEEIRAS